MIRKGKWKYVYYFDAPNQLYDLDKDPNELTNLIENNYNYFRASQRIRGYLQSY